MIPDPRMVRIYTPCDHPKITQEQMQEGFEKAFKYADSSLHSHKCPDCNQWQFPEFNYETDLWELRDEPIGAGR